MITIRNKKTGEVKQIEETRLGDFGLAPKTPQTSQKSLLMPTPQAQTPLADTKMAGETPTAPTQKITFDQLYKMSLDPNIKPATYNKFKALYDLQKEENEVQKLTADEIKLKEDKEKADSLKKTALETIDQLLERDTGAITGLKNPIKSLTGENAYTQNLFKQIKSLLSLENVKFLKGQGAVSDSERELLASSATALDTNLRNEDFYGELLKIKGALTGQPIESQKKKTGGGIVDALTLGTARRFAQDVGVGAGMNLEPKTQEAFDATLEMANKAEEKAKLVSDPVQREKLLKVAQQARATVSGESTKMGGKFSEDIDKGYAGRAFETAASVATAGEFAGLVPKVPAAIATAKAGVSKAVPLFKGVFSAKPAKITEDSLKEGLRLADEGSFIRNTVLDAAEKSGKKLPGTKFVSAIEEWATRAKRANPTKQALIDKYVTAATKTFKGKNIKPSTAKNLWDDASNGFSTAGKSGKTLEASYHRAVRDSLRQELDKIAPGFEAGTIKIKEGLQLDKFLKGIRNSQDRKVIIDALKEEPSLIQKFIKGVGRQAGGIITTAAAFKLLGLGSPKKLEE